MQWPRYFGYLKVVMIKVWLNQRSSYLLYFALGDLFQLLPQPVHATAFVVEVAFVVFRQSVPRAVDVAALALHAQKSHFLIAVEAALLVLLLLAGWQVRLEVVEVFDGRRDFGLGSGDWREQGHFFLFGRLGGTGLRGNYWWHLGQWDSSEGGAEGKKHLQVHFDLVGVRCSRLIIKGNIRLKARSTFQKKLLIKIRHERARQSAGEQNVMIAQSLQPITFSRSSHMRMLLPRTTTLQRILRSLPLISKAFSRAKFMKTSTPMTMPSISRPPLSLMRSFLATYLLRSGEQPCLGSGRLIALPLPAIYNRLIITAPTPPPLNIQPPPPSPQLCLQQVMQKERELFESMLCKFVVNLPEEELRDTSRLSYHAEKAFYYYVDLVLREKELKDWQRQRNEFFFKLKQYSPEFVRIDPLQLAARLQENKPVCGAIIFNRENTKVLVVKVRNKFGFPKGKWNQHETTQACAAREVQEETGLYIHHRMDPKIRIEFETHGSSSYFFVARGVGEEERTKVDRKEIDGVSWMWIEDVRLNLSRFVERSKIAWAHYEKEATKKSRSIEEFIQEFNKSEKQLQTEDEISMEEEIPNPFLCFKLNKQRLRQCLFAGDEF